MSTNLRELMERHAEASPPPLGAARLDQIRRRIARHRRTRALAGSASVAALVVAVVAMWAAVVAPAPMTPAVPKLVYGIPEYAQGGRVVAGGQAVLPTTHLDFTYVVPTQGLDLRSATPVLGYSFRCSVDMSLDISINGKPYLNDVTCGSLASFKWFDVGIMAIVGNVVVGRPVTFEVAPVLWPFLPPRASPYAPPVTGSYAMAISVPVPSDQYPFPPRPAQLKPLVRWPDGVARIDSNPADPLAPVSTTVIWQYQDIRLECQTPGELVITIAGRTVETYYSWDYETETGLYSSLPYDPSASSYLAALDGQPVTVTVTPRQVSGAWTAGLEVAPPIAY
jgi:hypothetical protein